MPNFPDRRIIRDGDGLLDADFPGIPKTGLARAYDACVTIVRQHPPVPPPNRPPSAATLQHMRQFAACMRQNGAPSFPDPHANGTFPILGTEYAGMAPYHGGEGLSRTANSAMMQCLRFQVEWRMRAS